MCTCAEPQTWISPLWNNSSPWMELCLWPFTSGQIDSTGWMQMRCWKSLHRSHLSLQCEQDNLALWLPPQISQAAAAHCQKWQHGVCLFIYLKWQITNFTWENGSLREFSSPTWSVFCDAQLPGSEQCASNQAKWPFRLDHKIFISTEHITGCMPHSHSFFMRNNSLPCTIMLYINWCDASLNPISPLFLRQEVDNDDFPSHL